MRVCRRTYRTSAPPAPALPDDERPRAYYGSYFLRIRDILEPAPPIVLDVIGRQRRTPTKRASLASGDHYDTERCAMLHRLLGAHPPAGHSTNVEEASAKAALVPNVPLNRAPDTDHFLPTTTYSSICAPMPFYRSRAFSSITSIGVELTSHGRLPLAGTLDRRPAVLPDPVP